MAIRISADSAARLATATKLSESSVRGDGGSRTRARYPVGGFIPFLRLATTGSGGIPAAGGITVPSSGPITLYTWSDGGVVADTTDTGWNFASGTGNSVAANTTVIVGWISGHWVVLWELCA